MDSGPFRVPQPTHRGTTPRRADTTLHRQPEPQIEPEPAPKPAVTRQAPQRGPKKHRSKLPVWLIVAGAVVIAAVIGWFVWSKMQTADLGIDSSRYQAVFFTNGQVYFGKLEPFNNETMRLTDVYYLQAEETSEQTDPENLQETVMDQGNMQLIKLGDEIHGPEDEMIILKNQVLFYENLRPDGQVAQSISEYRERQ